MFRSAISPFGSLFVAGDPSLVGSKSFPRKALFLGQNEWGKGQLDPQVMFIHQETPFGALDTILPPLNQEIEKHRQILGLVKFANLKFSPVGLAHLYQTTLETVWLGMGTQLLEPK